jgi:hypothetical protein
MNNPTVLTLFSVVFILLGSYNVFTGYKRVGEARARGTPLKWYKQISVLTGIEYILLALVFIISSAVRSNSLPRGLSSIVVPFYFVLLLAAAILAGLVIRQGIMNARAIRAQSRTQSSTPTAKSNGTSAVTAYAEAREDARERVTNLERKRERRRNAAAARRRRAGKA